MWKAEFMVEVLADAASGELRDEDAEPVFVCDEGIVAGRRDLLVDRVLGERR